jgi:preprotein translocase subunit SecF
MISVSLFTFWLLPTVLSPYKAFALPMAIGSISGCYSTICISGPLWVMWKKKKGDNILFVEEKKKKPETKKYYLT